MSFQWEYSFKSYLSKNSWKIKLFRKLSKLCPYFGLTISSHTFSVNFCKNGLWALISKYGLICQIITRQWEFWHRIGGNKLRSYCWAVIERKGKFFSISFKLYQTPTIFAIFKITCYALIVAYTATYIVEIQGLVQFDQNLPNRFLH